MEVSNVEVGEKKVEVRVTNTKIKALRDMVHLTNPNSLGIQIQQNMVMMVTGQPILLSCRKGRPRMIGPGTGTAGTNTFNFVAGTGVAEAESETTGGRTFLDNDGKVINNAKTGVTITETDTTNTGTTRVNGGPGSVDDKDQVLTRSLSMTN